MWSFFKHKKFWLPWVVLLGLFLITEIMLRVGWYDKWVKPESFLGDVTYRLKAIESQGLDQINWITVGDSRVDWGINHQHVAALRQKQGLVHTRMSFGSANFVSIQTTIDWSMANMSSLQGVMLGISENGFAHYSYMNKQYKVAWPFKAFMDFDNYRPLHPYDEWLRHFYSLAWVTYFADIKAFINNPKFRFNRIRYANRKGSIDAILNFKKEVKDDLCAHPLKTIDDCIQSTRVIDHTVTELDGFSFIHRSCSTPIAKLRAAKNLPVPPVKNQAQLIKNWTTLIDHVLQQNKDFVLLLLPEHESHDYIYKPQNAGIITQQIIAAFDDHPNFKLIDLRDLFADKKSCQYFGDPTHFNNAGIDLVNQALLSALKSF